MKIRQCNAIKLERITRNKDIICFGSGNNFTRIFENMRDLQIEKRIKYIVDNESKKWGTLRKINDTVCLIKNPEDMLSDCLDRAVLLITIIDYQKVLGQVKALFNGERQIECLIYPQYRYWFDPIADSLTRKLPIMNAIIFQGEGDTWENAAAVAKAWRENDRYRKYKIVWLCDHPRKFGKKRNENFVLRDMPLKRHSALEIMKYYCFLNRVHYLVYENKMIKKVRPAQVSCYMNHGIPLKATKGKIDVYEDTDYVLSPSRNINDIIMEQFGARSEQITICGAPRTDVFFTEGKCERLAEYLHNTEYEKIILWAPTFRTYEGFSRRDSEAQYKYGLPLIVSEEALDSLIQKLKEKRVLLVIKPHIHQELSELVIAENKHIHILKQDTLNELKANVYDLMKLSDALITDYSSIGFDYLLLDRQIGYTIDDIEQYKIGFSVNEPLDYMVGLHMKRIEDLLRFIEGVAEDKDSYFEERRRMKRFLYEYDDGNNSQRVLDLLKL